VVAVVVVMVVVVVVVAAACVCVCVCVSMCVCMCVCVCVCVRSRAGAGDVWLPYLILGQVGPPLPQQPTTAQSRPPKRVDRKAVIVVLDLRFAVHLIVRFHPRAVRLL
jgi:hypothetical protein